MKNINIIGSSDKLKNIPKESINPPRKIKIPLFSFIPFKKRIKDIVEKRGRNTSFIGIKSKILGINEYKNILFIPVSFP